MAARGAAASAMPNKPQRRCSPTSWSGRFSTATLRGWRCCWHTASIRTRGLATPPTRVDGAYAWAVRTGSTDIVGLLVAAGAAELSEELDPVEELVARVLAGASGEERQADPAVLAEAIQRRPGAVSEAVELRRPVAVRRLVNLGFDVHGSGTGATPLHEAAYGGDLAMCRLLVELGADPQRKDPAFRSTPIGWAEHAHAEDVAEFLREVAAGRSVDRVGQSTDESHPHTTRPTRST